MFFTTISYRSAIPLTLKSTRLEIMVPLFSYICVLTAESISENITDSLLSVLSSSTGKSTAALAFPLLVSSSCNILILVPVTEDYLKVAILTFCVLAPRSLARTDLKMAYMFFPEYDLVSFSFMCCVYFFWKDFLFALIFLQVSFLVFN